MLLLHRGIQAIKIRELGDIPLNRGHVLADLSYGCIQFAFTATGDVDVRTLCDEAPGRGQADAAAATRDDRDFSFKFCHDFYSSLKHFITQRPESRGLDHSL